MIIKNCLVCNKEFKVYLSRVNKGQVKYCSYSCYSIIQRREEPRNCLYCKKNFLAKLAEIKRGSGKYCSVKCFRAKNKDESHYKWLGNKVGYDGLHDWVKKYLGYPDICEFCQKSGLNGNQIDWANKSHEYKRELTDWIRLCRSCHRKYDKLFIGARQKVFPMSFR